MNLSANDFNLYHDSKIKLSYLQIICKTSKTIIKTAKIWFRYHMVYGFKPLLLDCTSKEKNVLRKA